MKVYVVNGEAGWNRVNHWTERVFSSEESAKGYIQEQKDRCDADFVEADTLERKEMDDELSPEEDEKLSEIIKRWPHGIPHYSIVELDLLE